MAANPLRALSGLPVGHICDGCNRRLTTGDGVRCYATRGTVAGWELRRLWCLECGSEAIERGTHAADEVLVEAIFWHHQIVAPSLLDRSRPAEGIPGEE